MPSISHSQANLHKVNFIDAKDTFSTVQNLHHLNINFDQSLNSER